MQCQRTRSLGLMGRTHVPGTAETQDQGGSTVDLEEAESDEGVKAVVDSSLRYDETRVWFVVITTNLGLYLLQF